MTWIHAIIGALVIAPVLFGSSVSWAAGGADGVDYGFVSRLTSSKAELAPLVEALGYVNEELVRIEPKNSTLVVGRYRAGESDEKSRSRIIIRLQVLPSTLGEAQKITAGFVHNSMLMLGQAPLRIDKQVVGRNKNGFCSLIGGFFKGKEETVRSRAGAVFVWNEGVLLNMSIEFDDLKGWPGETASRDTSKFLSLMSDFMSRKDVTCVTGR